MKTLRVLEKPGQKVGRTEINIFEGDIEKNRKYWKEVHDTEARYFKLEEVKDDSDK